MQRVRSITCIPLCMNVQEYVFYMRVLSWEESLAREISVDLKEPPQS